MAKYRCALCGKEHANALQLDGCEKSHKVVYIPVLEEDLPKLVQFIFTGDKRLVPERLIRTLMEYTRKFRISK